MHTEHVPDTVTRADLPISGLRFEPNRVSVINAEDGWFTKKISSSSGPLISDFVTHEATFKYSTYGIHIGQDDRLTFFGHKATPIVAEFVDCRAGSETLHRHFRMSFSASPERRLVIPRGVAHTFDNLEHIVTRDEPVWHSDLENPDWNFDNDLISVSRSTEVSDFPVVRANRFLLPDDAHRLQSRLSQKLLENPSAYLARYQMKIGAETKYISFEPTFWSDDQGEVSRLTENHNVPGVAFIRARYALTGPRSWTLVPTIDACVADVLFLPRWSGQGLPRLRMHTRTRKLYTVMSSQGAKLVFRALDCRTGSKTFGKSFEIETISDPRVVICIDNGIAYSISLSEDSYVRSETELFVSSDEPRVDLPAFNNDCIPYEEAKYPNGIRVPEMKCPSNLVYSIAKFEVSEPAAN